MCRVSSSSWSSKCTAATIERLFWCLHIKLLLEGVNLCWWINIHISWLTFWPFRLFGLLACILFPIWHPRNVRRGQINSKELLRFRLSKLQKFSLNFGLSFNFKLKAYSVFVPKCGLPCNDVFLLLFLLFFAKLKFVFLFEFLLSRVYNGNLQLFNLTLGLFLNLLWLCLVLCWTLFIQIIDHNMPQNPFELFFLKLQSIINGIWKPPWSGSTWWIYKVDYSKSLYMKWPSNNGLQRKYLYFHIFWGGYET